MSSSEESSLQESYEFAEVEYELEVEENAEISNVTSDMDEIVSAGAYKDEPIADPEFTANFRAQKEAHKKEWRS